LYENEVNTKNARGNTPFHYACLRGNIEIVLGLYYMKKANQAQSQARVQPVNLTIMNKAGYLPIQLAISRSHYFVVHFLLSQEAMISYLQNQNVFEIYRCLKMAISARAS
jgi:ankyrin repeat protein